MQAFIAKKWQQFLSKQQLDNFDAWWTFEAGWFEEPNERRGGWSGVSRVEFDNAGSEPVALFLKRQQEHTTRTWRHPLKGILTFEREAQNILACEKAGVPTLELVMFEKKTIEGKRCAVLVSVALDDFTELVCVKDKNQRRAIIRACADTVARLHEARLQHNCLYPKHIFVRTNAAQAEARLIDLEKAKRVRRPRSAMLRDLDSLNRHADDWTRTDKLRFLLDYLGEAKVNDKVRAVWQALLTMAERKQRKHNAS